MSDREFTFGSRALPLGVGTTVTVSTEFYGTSNLITCTIYTTQVDDRVPTGIGRPYDGFGKGRTPYLNLHSLVPTCLLPK